MLQPFKDVRQPFKDDAQPFIDDTTPDDLDMMLRSTANMPGVLGSGLPIPIRRLATQAGAGLVDAATLGLLKPLDTHLLGGQVQEAFEPKSFSDRMARTSGEFAGFVFGAPMAIGKQGAKALLSSPPGKKFTEVFTRRVGEKAMNWLAEGLGLGVASAVSDVGGLADAYADREMDGLTDMLSTGLEVTLDRAAQFGLGAATGARFGAVRDLVKTYGWRAFTNISVSNMIHVALADGEMDWEQVMFNSLLDLWFSRKGKPPTAKEQKEVLDIVKTFGHEFESKYNVNPGTVIKEVVAKYAGARPAAVKPGKMRITSAEDFASSKFTSNDRVDWVARVGDAKAREALAEMQKKANDLKQQYKKAEGDEKVDLQSEHGRYVQATLVMKQMLGDTKVPGGDPKLNPRTYVMEARERYKKLRDPELVAKEAELAAFDKAPSLTLEEMVRRQQLRNQVDEMIGFERAGQSAKELQGKDFVRWASRQTDEQLRAQAEYHKKRTAEILETGPEKGSPEHRAMLEHAIAESKIRQALGEDGSDPQMRVDVLRFRGHALSGEEVPGVLNTVDRFQMKLNDLYPEINIHDKVFNNVFRYFSDPQVSTKDYIEMKEEQLEELKDHSNNVFKALSAVFDVEHPFKNVAIGRDPQGKMHFREAKETGLALKLIHSVEQAMQNRGKNVLRDVAKDLKYNEEMMRKLVLAYENPSYLKELPLKEQIALKKPIERITEFFDRALTDLKNEGVPIASFKETMMAKLENRMKKASDPVEAAKIKDTMNILKETNFEHIPINIWFEQLAKADVRQLHRLLNYITPRDRKTLRIYDLVKAGVLPLEQVHIRDVMGSYSNRLGKDLALARLISAAKKDGLAVEWENSSSWYKAWSRPYDAPALKGYKVHPMLNEYIKSMTGYEYSRNLLSRGFHAGMAAVKMGQFYNPLFLGYYNTVQGTMIGSWYAPAIPKPKYLRQAVKDMKEFSAEWQAAEEWGIASKPYKNRFQTYMDELNKIVDPGFKPLQKVPIANEAFKYVRDILRHASGVGRGAIRMDKAEMMEATGHWFGLKDMYNMSWNAAWWGDRLVRQSTYSYLRDRGFSQRDAAQTAAMFHGDYAGVPVATREMLNKIFFTPTFKIAMAKLHYNMVKGAIKDAGGLAGPIEKRYRYGIFTTGAMLLGFDLMMRSLGFERETFAIRYRYPYVTKEGPKEFILHMSMPANLAVKYFDKAKETITGRQGTVVERALKQIQFEFHPNWQIAAMLKENRDREGDPITNNFDTPGEIALKYSKFILESALPMLQLSSTTEKEEETKEAAKELLGMWETVTRPFTYRYLRDPKWSRLAKELLQMQKLLQQDIKNDAFDEHTIEMLMKRIDMTQEELFEALPKATEFLDSQE